MVLFKRLRRWWNRVTLYYGYNREGDVICNFWWNGYHESFVAKTQDEAKRLALARLQELEKRKHCQSEVVQLDN